MSAAAARRRKQLQARAKAAAESGGTEQDVVMTQLNAILLQNAADEIEESVAYESIQLAQSQVRKREKAGEYGAAVDLAYEAALALLKKRRISVASQLLALLVEVLRETHTVESDALVDRIKTLHDAHVAAMAVVGTTIADVEMIRLERLQGQWLRSCIQWSTELGKYRMGHNTIHELFARQCWTLAGKLQQATTSEGEEPKQPKQTPTATLDGEEDDDELMDLYCDALQHAALAENPALMIEWLATLPDPTKKETKANHMCPPALRESLLTRSLLLLVAVENLRDANALLTSYLDTIETRGTETLTKSYTNKEDGRAPSHPIFGCMLVRVCEKDARTAPLYTWLLRSFKKELEKFYKPQVVASYTTKIGKIYFDIQPPPSMLNTVENMMAMMGGGGGMGGGGRGGGPAGIDPAMMQAMMAQMQGGGMM